MDKLVEGIYLEVKRSKVGTGHTQSEMTFRNLYLVRACGHQAQAVLLDDKLNPTGVCEPISPGAIASRGWRHVPQLQNRVEGICARLATPQPREAPPPPAARRQAAPPPAQRPQEERPAPQPEKPQEERNWWDLTSPGSGNLFGK